MAIIIALSPEDVDHLTAIKSSYRSFAVAKLCQVVLCSFRHVVNGVSVTIKNFNQLLCIKKTLSDLEKGKSQVSLKILGEIALKILECKGIERKIPPGPSEDISIDAWTNLIHITTIRTLVDLEDD